MKLTIALSVVFVLAIGVTLATPIGDELRERYNPRATPRTPEFYELMTFPEMLINNTLDTEGRTQNLQQTLNRVSFVPVNVLQTPETELPEIPKPLEPQNATGAVGSLAADYPTKASKREYISNNSVAFDNVLEDDVENYTRIHGNCSHCMEELENATSIKYLGCMCSLFTTKHPSELDSPLTSKLFQNISCHQSVPGEEACTKHCIFMAASYNELKDDIICAFLQHASGITVYLQAKLCEEDSEWSFTGVSSPAPVCCHMGIAVPC